MRPFDQSEEAADTVHTGLDVAHDTTQERSYSELREYLVAIVDSSDDAIIGKDLNGVIQTWNKGAEQMFGYTATEAVGKPVTMLAVPSNPGEIPNILERISRGERVDHYQTKRLTKDGRLLFISLTVSPIHDAAGRVMGASKIARDVTALVSYQDAQREIIDVLHRSEAALRNSESSFRQLADSMPQMVWTATPEGNVDYYNQRWHDYTGLNLEESKNWGWKPVLHPDHLQSTIALWTHAFSTGEPFKVEVRLRRASDGVYRWHLSQARPIRDADGNVMRWYGTCSDIEDYKKAESEIRTLNEDLEERVRERTAELDRANLQLTKANQELNAFSLRLEQTNRELQDFASVASHDLQEPLRKVQTFGDRLRSTAREAMDEQARNYLDRMLTATKRMQSLIEDLLKFARITSHTQPFSPVDLTQVLREVLSDLEVRIVETNAQVEVDKLPTIEADSIQMHQLLLNLLGNALKFHQEGKRPAIRIYVENPDLRPADGMFRLVVEDQGIGFDEKYLDRIFTVFQRLHGIAEYEGTGVGLAICRKIAQRHGGNITAKSTPGRGASFVVALPLLPGIPADSSEDAPRQANGGARQTANSPFLMKENPL